MRIFNYNKCKITEYRPGYRTITIRERSGYSNLHRLYFPYIVFIESSDHTLRVGMRLDPLDESDLENQELIVMPLPHCYGIGFTCCVQPDIEYFWLSPFIDNEGWVSSVPGLSLNEWSNFTIEEIYEQLLTLPKVLKNVIVSKGSGLLYDDGYSSIPLTVRSSIKEIIDCKLPYDLKNHLDYQYESYLNRVSANSPEAARIKEEQERAERAERKLREQRRYAEEVERLAKIAEERQRQRQAENLAKIENDIKRLTDLAQRPKTRQGLDFKAMQMLKYLQHQPKHLQDRNNKIKFLAEMKKRNAHPKKRGF